MISITGLSSDLPSAFNIFSKEVDMDGIKIYATQEVTDTQLQYVTSIFNQLLENDDGTIRANMVQNGAGLTMFANADQRDSAAGEQVFESAPNRILQDLQADEVFPPDMATKQERDAAVEEVTHLIHNSGITPAHPSFQQSLDQATQAAISAGLYHPERIDDDLPAQDYDDEYLAAGIEAYYNTKYIENNGESRSVYTPQTRNELKAQDDTLFNLIEQLFPAELPAAQLLNKDSNEFALQGLYLSYFNRSADLDGLNYWSGQMSTSGMTLASISIAFEQSSEYEANPLTNDAFVSQLYTNLLGRAYGTNTDGTYWLDNLNTNQNTRADLINQFISGAQGNDLLAVHEKINQAFVTTSGQTQVGIANAVLDDNAVNTIGVAGSELSAGVVL